MDGFTVSNANRFLQTGRLPGDSQRMEISGQSNSGLGSISGTGNSSSSQKSFADTLNEAINSVNTMQQQSNKGMQDLATGRTDNIAEVMIQSEKADIAIKLMMQVRNKIIDAYQEVMKMQV